DDIFDYYPTIQDRLRWLIGAKDLKEAREEIKEFTLEGRAHRIECPLLVGYSPDDRVMDPRGALKLYEKAVNSPQREMLAGVGHGEKRFDRRTFISDWFMKQLDAGCTFLRSTNFQLTPRPVISFSDSSYVKINPMQER